MIDFVCEMFPAPMIIDVCNKKRGREIKLRPDRDLPVAKFMCVEPVPMELDEDEREPFVFLAIPLLIRCVNVPY